MTDPREWKPIWEMTARERIEYAEIRASLEVLGCVCLSCLDVGLPCYHEEREDVSRVLRLVTTPMVVR